MQLFVTILFFGIALFSYSDASAATVKLMKEFSTPELSAIALYGEISRGDANELLGTVAATKQAIIFLASDGGDANEGLALAKLIRKLGYATAVIGNTRCMSACALIWIGGSQRYLSKDAIVGFHSVYTSDGVSGGGNAIYGAFYGQLGLSDRAIVYLTSAPPNGYNQVTLDAAPLLDIEVRQWDVENKQQDATPPRQSGPTALADTSFAVERGVDIIGFDLPRGSFKTESQESCNAACITNSVCKAYTYDTNNGVCYQKMGGRLLLSNSNAISGARASINQNLKRSSIVIHGKKNSPGFDFKLLTSNSLEQCVFECDNDQNCKAFTWIKKTNSCKLKTGYTSLVLERGAVSGLK